MSIMRQGAQRSGAPGLSRHAGYLLGWCALGIVNLVLSFATIPSTLTPWLALMQVVHDVGQMVAVGLLVSGVTRLWDRYASQAPAPLGWGAAAGLAALLGALVVGEDFEGIAESLVGPDTVSATIAALGAVAGASVVVTYAVAHWLARPVARWLVVAAGLAIAILNGLVLARLYTGLHLVAAGCSAALIGGALSGVSARWPRSDRSRTLGLALLCGWAATVLVLAPPVTVANRMFALPSSALAPYLAQWQWRPSVNADVVEDDWLVDRSGLPDVPPTTPALLTTDDLVVVFLVVDCLRADVVAHADEHRLPALDRMRQHGVSFTQAWAPGPATGPSVAAMFTGRYYSQMYWTKRRQARKVFPYDDEFPRFPELLSASGVPTVEIAGLRVFTNQWGIIRGSDEEYRSKKREAPADWIVDTAIERLERHHEGPLFIHSHFMEAHAPYDQGEAKGSDFERHLGELRIIDEQIGRLVDWIDASAMKSRAVVVVTADHGEAFGEHNTRFHATTMYEELLRVPLLFRAPALRSRVVDDPVVLVDIGPTILDLFGVPTPSSFLGQSLVPHLMGLQPALSRPVAAESGRFMRALRFGDGLKIIEDSRRKTVELYDLVSDPDELHNLYDERLEDHRKRLATMRAFFAAHEYSRKGYETPYRR